MGTASDDVSAVSIDALKCNVMIARTRRRLEIGRVLSSATTVVI